jgi:hypothetical protein
MKRYIILSILAVVCNVACTDFLAVKPEGNLNEGAFFQTDQHTLEALNRCYRVVTQIVDNRDFYWEWGACGDDMILGRPRNEEYHRMKNFEFTGRESVINNVTRHAYEHLSICNWVVQSLLRKSNPSEIDRRGLGEAYFLRAFCHFYIAYRHGRPDQGVPYDRFEDYDHYSYGVPEQRASVMENYDLIIQDLEKAAELVPFFESYGPENYGRVHKAAAWAYMVKVYAYWAQHDPSKWALIPPLVDRIEKEGKRELLPTYQDVFLMANEWGSEYIWAMNCVGRTDVNLGEYAIGSVMGGVFLENKAWGRYNGWGYFKPTLGLYEEFAEGDERRGVSILEYNDEFVLFGETRRFYSTSDDEAGFQVNKYMEPWSYGQVYEDGHGESPYVSTNGDWMAMGLNIAWIRFAEMILFKAEALIMQNQGAAAATELNRITRRAGLGNVYTTATLDDLKHERRCELAFEPTDRFMDLKRWKDYDRLNAPRYIRQYADRADPLSTWTRAISESWGTPRTFNPATDIAFPYNPDDVVKANGKLKQNPMD